MNTRKLSYFIGINQYNSVKLMSLIIIYGLKSKKTGKYIKWIEPISHRLKTM